MADEVARLVAVMEADLKAFTKGMEQAQRIADQRFGAIEKTMEQTEATFPKFGTSLESLVTRISVATLGWPAFRTAISALHETAQLTPEKLNKLGIAIDQDVIERAQRAERDWQSFWTVFNAGISDGITRLRQLGPELESLENRRRDFINKLLKPPATDLSTDEGLKAAIRARDARLNVPEVPDGSVFVANREVQKEAAEAAKKAAEEELKALEEIHAKIADFERESFQEEIAARQEISDKIIAFEREMANEQIDAEKEIADKIAEAQALVSNEKFEKAANAVDSLRDAFDITGAAGVRAFENIGDAFEQMAQQIAAKAFQLGVMDPILDALFGKKGTPGGILGTAAKSLFGFAEGGSPPIGRASIVGERGPELFVPRVSGTIIPNNRLGGTVIAPTVNISLAGANGDAALLEATRRAAQIGIAGAVKNIEGRFPSLMLEAQKRVL